MVQKLGIITSGVITVCLVRNEQRSNELYGACGVVSGS
jgi:hypothetical protein